MSEQKNINSSIVFKLNTWHLGHILALVIWLDVLIVSFFAIGTFYYAENDISSRYEWEQQFIFEQQPDGVKPLKIFNGVFPNNTQNAYRGIKSNSYGQTFWGKVQGLKYRVLIPHDNTYAVLEYDIGKGIGLFLKFFVVLLIFELLYLIKSIAVGAGAMRKALRPIAELAETTRSINTSKPDLQLRDLKGTIDSINAERLDTVVKVSSSQNELKDLAGAINGMLRRINDSYRSQVRFVSDASHELRTPIAVIQGYANLLDRWGKNDEKALEESIAAIKSEAEGMKELVEQLLFLARGDNDSMHLSMEEINIGELVSETVREAIMIDPAHEFCYKTEGNAVIIGDVQLIKQALRILVDNSIKYTPTGETITVMSWVEGDFVKLSVKDNGIGIPAEDLPYVFDRFFRADDSRARKTGGTGLGLSIAKWIIDRHGGSAEILSRKDIGTKITVTLKANTVLQ